MAQLKDSVVSGNLRVTDTTFTDTLQATTGNISNSEWKAFTIKRTTTNGAGVHFENSNGYLGAIGMNAVNGTLKRWKTDQSTSYEIIDRSLVRNNTAKGSLGWTSASADTVIPTVNTIAYWDGAYSGTSSNLTYCVKGAFGSIITKNLGTSTSTFLRNDGEWATPVGTTYSAGTGLSLSGTTFNHSNSVTAGTAKGDDSKTLTFGGTFTIPSVTYDAQGHITAKGTTTMTMPSNPNTDTKVKVTSNTTTKAYLIGTTSTPDGSAVEGIADTGVYLDSTAGKLTTGTLQSNGNITLYKASGDSPALIFQRGTMIDNLNDWKIYVSGGGLYFAQSTANASSETWTNKMYFHPSDGNLYVGSTKVSLNGHTHDYSKVSFTQTLASGTEIGSITIDGTATTLYCQTNTDTKVTSSANHYTPSTASGSDISKSASGATAAWSIDVVKGVTLNTDGKGHVTGMSVTSGKIPANPVPSNNVTGSGTSGYLTKWNGTNTITSGPQLGSSTLTYLRNDGTWAEPVRTAFSSDDSSDFASYAWHKFAEITTTKINADYVITFLVSKTWSDSTVKQSGILTAHLRTGGTPTFSTENSNFNWLVAGVDINVADFVMVYINTENTSCKVELWYKQTARYDGWIFTVLKEHSRRDNIDEWTLFSASGHGSASYTTGSGNPIVSSISQTLTSGIKYKTLYDASLANNNVSSGSIAYPSTFNITDKSDRIMVRLEGQINSNGNIGSSWYVKNYDTSGTQTGQKGIKMSMAKDGTLTYSVDEAAAFRTAIGAGTSSLTIGTTATTAAAGNHTHGNITNGGALQTTDITIASGDKLVVTDSSDSNKVARTSIAFGSSETSFLRNDGSWATPVGTTYTAGNHLSLSSNQFSIASYCKTITDWNSATTNGWYMGSSVTNAPSTAWWFGRVIAHNAKYCLQEAWAFSSGSNTDARYLSHKLRWFKSNTWGNWVDFSIYHVGANNRTVMSDGNGLLFTTPTSNAWAQGLNYNNTSGTQIGFIGAYGGGVDTLSRFDIGVAYSDPWFRVGNGNVTIYDNGTTGPKIILRDRIGTDAYLQYSVIASDNSENTRNVIKCASYDTNGTGLIIGQSTGGLTIIGAGDKVGQFEKAVLSTDKNPYGTTAWSYGTENLVNISDVNIYFVTGANGMSDTAFTDWTNLKTVILDSSGSLIPSITNKGSIGTSAYMWNSAYINTIYENGTSLANKYASKTHSHDYVPIATVSTSTDADTLFSETQWVNWNTTTAITTTHMPTTNYGLLLVKASPGPQVFFPDTGTGIYMRKKASGSAATEWMGITGTAGNTYNLANFYNSTTSRTANTVLAAPNGSVGAATFRQLVAADIPDLSGSYLPLSGGTLTGDLTFSGFANATADADRHIFFKHNTANRICTNDNFKYNPYHNRLYCGAINRALIGTQVQQGQDQGSGVTNRYKPSAWKYNAGIKTLANGDTIVIQIPKDGISYGIWISVDNGTTYYPVASSGSLRLQTQFTEGHFVELVFRSSGQVTGYPISGAAQTAPLPENGGCWVVINYYDTDTKVRQTLTSGNSDRPILLSHATTSSSTTNVDNVSYRNNTIFANTATGAITAGAFLTTSGFTAPVMKCIYSNDSTTSSTVTIVRTSITDFEFFVVIVTDNTGSSWESIGTHWLPARTGIHHVMFNNGAAPTATGGYNHLMDGAIQISQVGESGQDLSFMVIRPNVAISTSGGSSVTTDTSQNLRIMRVYGIKAFPTL